MEVNQIPADLLSRVRFLPDGSATTNDQIFFQRWAEVVQLQIAQGKIKIYDVSEYNPDTGQVANSFIEQIYMKNRKLH